MAFDSLFTGVSGLNAYQSWIDTISNNIANTATTGFKGQRMTFADLFYQQEGYASGPTTTSGGVNPQDQGLGVKVNTIDTEFAQGGLEQTGINTDLGINGDGFFILNNANGTAAPTYTRDGAFSLNANGLLYDPASGLAVQGYTADSAGNITATGVPGNVTIPVGLEEQATATGAGAKVGPSGDQVFDMSMGGNLDQTQWSQQFDNAVGGSATPGSPVSISTTIYDSLGNAHQATITYTPDATGATAATGTAVAGAGTNIAGAVAVNPETSTTDNFTLTANATGTAVNVTDSEGNNINAVPGQVVTMGGATFTIAAAPAANGVNTFTINAATSGLPAQVDSAAGAPEVPATRWAVSISFADGTQFSTIATPGTVNAAGVATAAVPGSGSSGTIGFAYFGQNGQFINSSSIEGVAAGQSLTANAAGFLHTTGTGTNQPALAQGNELNVTQWGPSVGNNSSAPTANIAPLTGPIGLDYSNNASLAGAYGASVINQNGYAAGTLSNISVETDGTVLGSFTNGQQKALAQVALATFQNEDGLQRLGSNQFGQTAASGLAQIGTASTGRFGSIDGGALEESNVSLATEFTNLILAQRAFEANSRGITTADQNLITVTHLQASEN